MEAKGVEGLSEMSCMESSVMYGTRKLNKLHTQMQDLKAELAQMAEVEQQLNVFEKTKELPRANVTEK